MYVSVRSLYKQLDQLVEGLQWTCGVVPRLLMKQMSMRTVAGAWNKGGFALIHNRGDRA